MQLLYHNLLDDGTVTATNANSAYPVTNLTYKYQRSRALLAMFKSATNSSVISCTLATPATIDAIGVGNHNIVQLQIILKNSLGATICDETLELASLMTDYSPTKLTNLSASYSGVTYIELRPATTESILYIGGLYIGQSLTLQPAEVSPTAFQPISSRLTGSGETSLRGVVSGLSGVRLESIQWPMRGLSKSQLDTYLSMLEYCQLNRPMFINPNPGKNFRQWFARITSDSPNYQVYEGGDYDMTLEFEEVR